MCNSEPRKFLKEKRKQHDKQQETGWKSTTESWKWVEKGISSHGVHAYFLSSFCCVCSLFLKQYKKLFIRGESGISECSTRSCSDFNSTPWNTYHCPQPKMVIRCWHWNSNWLFKKLLYIKVFLSSIILQVIAFFIMSSFQLLLALSWRAGFKNKYKSLCSYTSANNPVIPHLKRCFKLAVLSCKPPGNWIPEHSNCASMMPFLSGLQKLDGITVGNSWVLPHISKWPIISTMDTPLTPVIVMSVKSPCKKHLFYITFHSWWVDLLGQTGEQSTTNTASSQIHWNVAHACSGDLS